MNPKSNPQDKMRPEYDFSGGVRGKYYERYQTRYKITITSDLVATSTSSAESVGAITRPASMTQPVLYAYSTASPKIEVGEASVKVNAR